MAKKKNITQQQLIKMYMDEVLTSSQMSKSVYAFAKTNNFDEAEFYNHFTSFESLEKSIFEVFFQQTIQLLEKSKEYQSYDAKQKLLSFYFTFFEVLSANRSYVFMRLQQDKNKLNSLKLLSKLRIHFMKYIEDLDIQNIDFKSDRLNDIQQKGIQETSWAQLLFTIQFWLNDESINFEKTDVFIEKSIKASFDVIEVTPVKSVFDLAKFLWKETVKV